MYLNQPRLGARLQKGSMLVISIFVIVVMSLLGLAMVNLLSASSDAVVHEVLGFRALNAAQTGLEAKVSEVFPLTEGETNDFACGFAIDHDFTVAQGLENCRFSSDCSIGYNQDNILYIRFTSTGQCEAGNVITSRTVSVDAKVEL